MTTTHILIFLLSIAASFIQRVSGFGFGIFVMMFFPFILSSYGEATTLSGLLAGTTALMIAIKNRKQIRWDKIGIVIIFNIAASAIAIRYISSLANETMKSILGAVLIATALYFIYFERRKAIKIESKGAQAIVGCISGVMGGMFAMPGPPVVLLCINAIKDKYEYMATLQALSVIFNVFYTLFRANAGFFTSDTPLLWAVGLGGLFIGTKCGAICFKKITSSRLKHIVYILMIISGIAAII